MTCPHIYTGGEGTSHCELSGKTADDFALLVSEIERLKSQIKAYSLSRRDEIHIPLVRTTTGPCGIVYEGQLSDGTYIELELDADDPAFMIKFPPIDLEAPKMTCPKCGHTEYDPDGFGMLHCSECGYCTHSDVTDGVCGVCGEAVEDA